VVNAQIWPTKVLNLVLRRPREFEYRAGQYAFIRIPSISNFQYHPFTLTSSPGTALSRARVHTFISGLT
jgi:respiratory burst oxidase